MPKSKNTYNKGLNQDSSRSKYDPSSYYDALNIRIVTHDGLSTGSIENEKGNSLTFTIPDVPERTLNFSDGTSKIIPAQSNLKIVGWCTVSNYIVIFTTNETVEKPTNSIGQIWKIKYNESTGNVITTGATLNVTDHLIYTEYLNFSTYHRIEAKGRFENNSKIRVYWTDFNSNLRTIDITDPNLVNTKADIINVIPNISFTKPILKRIGSGNLPAAAKVQYAYRLISSSGSQTVVSPTSQLVTLISIDASTETNYVDIVGDLPNAANAKSVTFEVKGLDLDYNIIEHIAILYTTKDAPQIFKFGEDTIPQNGEIEIVLDGSEDRIELTQAEFSLNSSGFDTCKTIDVKDNRLIAGNIVTEPAEINTEDWDSRAYRFNSSSEALILDADNNITLIGPTPDYSSVNEEHDAINPFNKERVGVLWENNYQYKYQVDGTTIGGSGPNVSYEFTQVDMLADTNNAISSRRSPPHIESTRSPNSTLINLGERNIDGSIVEYDISNEFKNFSSPIVESILTGYTRGEVYRFAIEFLKEKGNTTFVKWIGDIKFPEPADGFPVGTGDLDSGNLNLKSIGIKFTVDVSSIADSVSAYRIVRAERFTEDITRLGTGTIMILDRRRDDDAEGTLKRKNTLYESVAGPFNSSQIEVGIEDVNWDGNSTGGRFHLPDQPGPNETDYSTHQGVNLEYPRTKQNTILISPLTVFKDELEFEYQAGDYIKTLGYYQSRASQIVRNTGDNSDSERQCWVWTNRTFETSNHGTEAFEIDSIKYLNNGERIQENQLPSSMSGNDFINVSYGKTNGVNQKGYPFGVGDNIAFMVLKDTPNPGFTLPEDMDWNNNVQVNAFQISIHPLSYTLDVYRFKEVAYIRPLENQYGGNTFEARSKQKYISTNHFQPISSSVPTSLTFSVYGGDTAVSYWDREYMQSYLNKGDQDTEGKLDDPDNFSLGVAVLIPCESRINTEYTIGRHFAKDREGNNIQSYVNEIYALDQLYLQQNNSENKFFDKDFASSFVEEFPHRIWASEAKIDGELIDSWRNFKQNNFIDVEGTYGPINKVINFQDRLFYYQDRAFGQASINERSIITDTSGVELTVGTGKVLDDFRYISTSTGSFHQHSVVASVNALYHYDVILRKLYRFGGNGTQPLSDIKGLSSFFAKNVDNNIVEEDITLNNGSNIGIHGTFDYRHNRALFTFLSPKNDTEDFTVGYNEFLDAFESFYSFTPGIYLNTGRRLLSVDKNNPSTAYLHDNGEYGSFYGNIPDVSYITLMVSPISDIPKVFSNLEFNSEVSIDNLQQPLDTINSLEIWNDYQTTGIIPLIVGTNIKRRLRHWRHIIGRDSTSSNQRARMRDYSVFIKLSYNNNNDKRLVLHDVIISYTPTRD